MQPVHGSSIPTMVMAMAMAMVVVQWYMAYRNAKLLRHRSRSSPAKASQPVVAQRCTFHFPSLLPHVKFCPADLHRWPRIRDRPRSRSSRFF